MEQPTLRLHGCREHNLRGVDVAIPHGLLTVVTGVSGSGKSSLVFDTLHALGERRYLETLSAHARRYLQRVPMPRIDAAHGLAPSIAVAQRRGAGDHARSTVGTSSGLGDLLRIWFARHNGLEPRDLSFVGPGACVECRGLGAIDEVDPDLLVADPGKTLRQGALVPTTPNGYIVYSQVTVDALDTVCRAHGFDVDTPFEELSDEQRHVVFFGSDRVEVPFGKHSLESRMRWQGITAKPRELGHYRGLVPTITEILHRSRNENALRFARSVPCPACRGTRIGPAARDARVGDVRFADALELPLPELRRFAASGDDELADRLRRRLDVCLRLGLRHLDCARATATLSGGELQRLRLARVATAGLSGVTFVFDEPSIGLHASEEAAVVDLLLDLRDSGNTVVVVEHSDLMLAAADRLIDLGPGPGRRGGEVLFAGPPSQLGAQADDRSATRAHHAEHGERRRAPLRERRASDGAPRLELLAVTARNLRSVDVAFVRGRLNVVSGVAGAGKSTLVRDVLAAGVTARIEGRRLPAGLGELRGADGITRVVHVDAAPIGRTPRSNPATYTGVFDAIRKLFAALPEAKARGFTATTFSFNSKKGGRCGACEGSGREVVGMHGLPSVELPCASCGGRRFADEVLSVRLPDGGSIRDVLDTDVDDAVERFAGERTIAPVLAALQRVGLGHLELGQPATTLSGGEAQRVKLASELVRPAKTGGSGGEVLYVLEEPTIGLHRADVELLLRALDELIDLGHTVVLVEHDLDVLRAADHVVDLGPGAGDEGGTVCGEGTADHLARLDTPTGAALAAAVPNVARPRVAPPARPPMRLWGVATNNLRGCDLELPASGLTVVTGVSGSGKSSLVFDSLFGESRARMTEHLTTHVQRQLGGGGGARGRVVASADGLRPVVGLAQRIEQGIAGPGRATVATTAELHGLLRTLWSRLGGEALPAGAFSFFTHDGACDACGGLGVVRRCDPDALVVDAERPLFGGALADNRVVQAYADAGVRHRAILAAIARARGHSLDVPWQELPAALRHELLRGTGDEVFEVVWEHDGAEGGAHRFETTWPGIAGDIDREAVRRQQSGAKTRAADVDVLMVTRACEACGGDRLREPMRTVRVGGRTLPELCRLSVDGLLRALGERLGLDARALEVARDTLDELERRATRLVQLGLAHLPLDRPVASLSAGERQRLRLAQKLAAPLYGCVYVLDEPTVGLHPRDVDGLLALLRELCDGGNAVVVVEHDARVIAAADHVVEVGPGGGERGGRIVAAGAPALLPAESRTAKLLAAARPSLRTEPRRPTTQTVRIRGAALQNLRDLDVVLPVGALTVVAGVSGSGKTTLVRGVLAASMAAGEPRGCVAVDGLGAFTAMVDDAGARARRSPRACVATLLGCYEDVQKSLAATDAAKQRGFRKLRFAWLGRSGGACRACGGVGAVPAESGLFGADAWLACDACDGRRFDDDTLAVRWLGLDLAQLLDTTIDELLARLADGERAPKALRARLDTAASFGLGYLRLGQAADRLSGGEAQRVQLARHLTLADPGPTLFALDEPTRGLHRDDVTALLRSFEGLLAAGHTIVAIEHDLDVIAAADHVVELGPGTGEHGGRIVFEGSPAAMAAVDESPTGSVLRRG